MTPLDLVELPELMALTAGRSDITVGLVDGPIAMNHPDLTGDIREVPGKMSGTCAKTNSAACLHGTFVAGILCAKRGSAAPAICPCCTLLAYSICAETASGNTRVTPTERIVLSDPVHRWKNALSKIIVPAFPGRSTLSAGAVARGLAVITRAINISAA